LRIDKTRVQKIGLIAGPLIFTAVVIYPIEDLSFEAGSPSPLGRGSSLHKFIRWFLA
jgi:hypothetical protein